MGSNLDLQQLILPAVLFCLFLAAEVFFIYRQKQKGWIAEVFSGLLAAGIGTFLGMGAQILYTTGGEIPLFGNGVENPEWVGGAAGGGIGLLAGIWFARFVRELLGGGFSPGGIIGRGCLAGIILGVICSTLVHILLMAAYRNGNLWPMLIGAGFGVSGGLATGTMLATLFVLANKLKTSKVKEQA